MDGRGALRVLQITDSHLFSDPHGALAGVPTGPSYNHVLEAVVSEHWPLDLILFTGDLVHDGSMAGYRRVKRDLEELGVRALVIPGNHDDPANMRRVFAGGRVTWSRHLVFGGWQFIMLDSSVPGESGGALATEELAVLERTLFEGAAEHALVCLHHHPVPVGSHWIDRIGLANQAEFLALLDRFPSVRAVLWGHVHQGYESQRGTTQLLGCPSTSIQFRPGSETFAVDHRAAGFRLLGLGADGTVETRVQRLPWVSPELDIDCGSYR